MNNNMKIKNASGYNGHKLQTKKISQNPYRKKLDNLVPGNVLLPEQPNTEIFKLRAIKPPIKNLRMPMKIYHAVKHLPQINNLNNSQQNNYTNTGACGLKLRQNKKISNISEHGKKNAELLDHMIDILSNKEASKLHQGIQIKVSTEPDVFNEFINLETVSSKNSRGPILDPKISKFYEKNNNRRQVYSEEKSRNIYQGKLQGQRQSVTKDKNLENFQLMTFYKHKLGNDKHIMTTEQSQNQFI